MSSAQPDDGVGDRFLRQCDGVTSVERAGFDGEDGGEVFALQRFHEHVKHFAGFGAVRVADDASHAIDKNATGAHLHSLLDQEAVRLL